MTTSYYNIAKPAGSLIGHSRPQGPRSKRNSPMPFDPDVLSRLLMDELTGNGRRNARRAVGCYLNPLPNPPSMEKSNPLVAFDEPPTHLPTTNSWAKFQNRGLPAPRVPGCPAPFPAQKQWVMQSYNRNRLSYAHAKPAASSAVNKSLPAPTQPNAMFEQDMWKRIVPSRSRSASTQPKVMFELDMWRRIVPSRSPVPVCKVSDTHGAERKKTPDSSSTAPSAAKSTPPTSSAPANAATTPPGYDRSRRTYVSRSAPAPGVRAQKPLEQKKAWLDTELQSVIQDELRERRRRIGTRSSSDSELRSNY